MRLEHHLVGGYVRYISPHIIIIIISLCVYSYRTVLHHLETLCNQACHHRQTPTSDTGLSPCTCTALHMISLLPII